MGCNGAVKENDILSSPQNTDSNVPNGYDQLLLDFGKTVERVLSESFEEEMNTGKFVSPDKKFEYEWQAMLIDLTDGLNNPSLSSFGYILKDINKDNTPELFLVRDDYTILAVFTLNNEQPQLLGAFWSKNKAVMLDDNQIYILRSGGANYFEYSIWQMNANNQLLKNKCFGYEGNFIYESIDKDNIAISEARFKELLSTHPFIITEKWKNETITLLKTGD